MDECLLITTVQLDDGRRLSVRPLTHADAVALACLFVGLSERTRGYYGPHALDRDTAERLCAEIDHARTIRFVAMERGGTAPADIVAYMILTRELSPGDAQRYAEHGPPLHVEACASFAPVVADAWQERGLGSRMARHVLACARTWGLEQIILMGGVQQRNARGRRLYERLGFRTVGYFEVRRGVEVLGNYDMILEL